ncbi:MAG TPA: 3-hydroxyacyl-CoA dehydrogenase NAD-binding domain-containing protein [Acidobacteriota bacterium]|nr:3-hydroxyacyl-CoA dehydrogenase NAD-binding domain-containing protein [Acidobacteriota bacterium]
MEYTHANHRHWTTKLDSDGILWLCLDRADKNVNSLSREVLIELEDLLDAISQKLPLGIILYSGKPGGFIAGADVAEFASIVDASEVRKHIEWVHAVFSRLERLPIPTVSMIHGFCLGGGLELALACRCRIAVDIPETQLGTPEVKLNIHPGYGGTVRLIRLIGPLAALEMMLSGRSINAQRALRIGLVDYVVPERQKARAAQAAILHPPSRKKTNIFHSLFQKRFLRFLLSRYLRRMVARRADRNHYSAPYALLDLWERFGDNPFVMYREEARSVADLVTGSSARNLVRVFLLQERMRSLGRQWKYTPRSVHVIGGGTMGADIASWCVLQGLRVTIQDVEQERLATAVKRASELFRKKLKEPRRVIEALDRFVPDMRGDGAGRADVVIEAIFENAAAKRKLYQEVEPKMRQDALLATNTSSIPLEELAETLQHPERFVGLHFFNPVSQMPLVEVVRGQRADAARFNDAISFVSAIRRLPLPVVSAPGFLINRILTPYLLEAVRLEQEGIPADTIDRAAREFGMPMGPLLLADTVGLDICLSVGHILAGHFNFEVPKRLEDLVAMGRLGKKSGRGFYNHRKQNAIFARKKRSPQPDEDLTDRLILSLLNEAVACRREGIVSDGDLLDAGAVFGIGFAPFRGGPLHYIRTRGVDAIRARLKTLHARYGERFTPDPGWPDFPGF